MDAIDPNQLPEGSEESAHVLLGERKSTRHLNN